jgi:hypothetical protein
MESWAARIGRVSAEDFACQTTDRAYRECASLRLDMVSDKNVFGDSEACSVARNAMLTCSFSGRTS